MGEYIKAVTTAPHGTNVSAHVESIDEYFRKNFRKMSPRQALEILEPLGSIVEQKASCLDASFWTWETLEEAVRGDINTPTTFTDSEFESIMRAFGANYKGSSDLLDMIEIRLYQQDENIAM